MPQAWFQPSQLLLAADTFIRALYVTRILDEAISQRGLPKVIRSDNGPEFAGRIMQAWAAQRGIEHRFIKPGKPIQNAFIESFNGGFQVRLQTRILDRYVANVGAGQHQSAHWKNCWIRPSRGCANTMAFSKKVFPFVS